MVPIQDNKISAIILAAGLSKRMGTYKPLLKLGAHTALQHCLNVFTTIGVENITVVCGHHYEKLTPIITTSNATSVYNPHYKDGMFSSIITGIKSLPASCKAFFLLPVDIPLVRPATLHQLYMHFNQFKAAICYPIFDGHRGHPPLISVALTPDILNWQGSGGLAGFLRSREHQAMDVPVADQTILRDMDTPEDYQFLLRRVTRYDVATLEECHNLMKNVCQVSLPIQAHCKMVSRVARCLGEVLVKTGLSLDLDLLEAAASVHDVGRGQPNHAEVGKKLMNQWGFSALAQLVADHMDLKISPNDPLDERQILYLADKLVCENRLVDLDQRFQKKIDQYGEKPEAAYRIRVRWQTANTIRRQIETAAGQSIEKILISIFQSRQ